MPADPEPDSLDFPLIDDLGRLERAWAREHPKRAAGGIAALSGFRYQFLSVLLETVRAWDAAPREHRLLPKVWTERLSDLVRIESERAVAVTQIKRSATQNKLKQALAELWLIDQLARRETPRLSSVLRFRILTARGSREDLEAALAEWSPEDGSSDPTGVDELKRRVELSIAPNPEDELLALLANKAGEDAPLDRVTSWLGDLTSAAESGDFRGAAQRIWSDLIQASRKEHRRKPAGIVVWSAADQPPSAIERGDCLTGTQPMLLHLRKGFFAPRPQVYKAILDKAEDWIEGDPIEKDQGHRVPVFWIGGRSGSGKSVALLHLLAELHDQHRGTVLWLADKVENLPATLRWARELVQPGQRILVGLDDPFTPGQQMEALGVWREAMAALLDARESGRSEEVPLLICCGPTEQAHALRQELQQDVNLELYELPKERQEELDELRSWYRQRTGAEPPNIGNRNVLLVQLFFEWRTGKTLPIFASHFRRRLLAADASGALFGFVARVLALNRLYVGYSPEALGSRLSAAQRDLLNRLRTEEHIEEDREGRPGLWLAHPHLSNVIYEEWFRAGETREVRKEHLLAAIEDCLAFAPHPRQRMAPLWALLRVISGRVSDVADRVDVGTASLLLLEIYRRRISAGQPLALSELPVWVELRGVCPDLELNPDPMTLAIEAIHIRNLQETGLRLTCHKLLQNLEYLPEASHSRIAEAVVGLLFEAFPHAWYEWPAVALDAMARLRDERLWSLASGWARWSPKSRESARFLLRALMISNGEAGIVATARDLLAEAPADLAWGDVGRFLVADGQVPPAVETWLRRNHLEFSSCFLLSRLIDLRFAPATVWARAWSERWYLERVANYVLEGLCRIGVSDPDLRDWCKAWIEQQKADPSYLLEELLKAYPGDEEVRLSALSWLEATAASGRPSWSFIWLPLWKEYPRDVRLQSLARTWLQTVSPEHGSWNYVWEALWAIGPTDPELAQFARTRLQEAPPEHGSWLYLWKALWTISPSDLELVQLARTWLQTAPSEHDSWAFVWLELAKASSADPELAQLARTWLQEAPPEHGSWRYLWKALWTISPSDLELVQLARTWLQTAPSEHDSWAFVWLELAKASSADPELAQLARTWLQEAPPQHGSWHYLWKALWTISPCRRPAYFVAVA